MSRRRVVLASASPRRAALLEQIGLAFEIRAADVDESPHAGETAEALARRLAAAKADAVAQQVADAVVIGADTVVALDGAVFGKPRDDDDAQRMLTQLSGRTHRVCSGVAVTDGRQRAGRLCVSQVTMAAIDARAVAAYRASGEPRGKAGGYAIQGLGAVFVEQLSGSYSGVMGLPLREAAAALGELGIDVLAGR